MDIDTEKLYKDVEKLGDETLLEAVSELITSYEKAKVTKKEDRLRSIISEGFSLSVMRLAQISNALAQIAADLSVIAGSKTLNERLAEMGKAPDGVGTHIEEAIKKNELSEEQIP